MSIRRIWALFVKEAQDLRRNPNILYMLIVPPFMTWVYSGLIAMPPASSATIGTLFAVVMVGMYPPAMMVAEEKEKHTLNVLMLSPATPGEILISKGLVTALAVVLTCALVVVLSGAPLANLTLYLLIILIGTFSVIITGFIIGLLSPNQMATGYIGMPIYMALILIPMLAQVSPALKTLASFIPTNYVGDGIYKAINGESLASASLQIGVLGAFAAAMLIVFVFAYRKIRMEE